MIALKHTQQGTTLFVTLIFLVVLTLYGVSAISSSSMNLRVAGNMQFQQQATAAAQQGIEVAIGSLTTFTAPAAQSVNVDINKDGSNDYTAVLSPAACLSTKAAPGSDAELCAGGFCDNDTNWELVSRVNDAATGANVTIHQGVKVRLKSSVTC